MNDRLAKTNIDKNDSSALVVSCGETRRYDFRAGVKSFALGFLSKLGIQCLNSILSYYYLQAFQAPSVGQEPPPILILISSSVLGVSAAALYLSYYRRQPGRSGHYLDAALLFSTGLNIASCVECIEINLSFYDKRKSLTYAVILLLLINFIILSAVWYRQYPDLRQHDEGLALRDAPPNSRDGDKNNIRRRSAEAVDILGMEYHSNPVSDDCIDAGVGSFSRLQIV